jgi:hypothetical protein
MNMFRGQMMAAASCLANVRRITDGWLNKNYTKKNFRINCVEHGVSSSLLINLKKN